VPSGGPCEVENAMIYVLHRPLQQLLPQLACGQRVMAAHRQQIRHFREAHLNAFCQQQHLAAPQFALQPHGKPCCANLPQLVFNQSHSQQHYALVYSVQLANIGVDIEDLNRQLRMQAVAEHAFHAEEYHSWQQTGFDRKFWLKVWTLKEALLKAHGMGIRLSLNTLNTAADPQQNHGRVHHPILGEWCYQTLYLPSSVLSIAYPPGADPQSTQLIYL
jgi:4'-phosphopantetheinyl transferase